MRAKLPYGLGILLVLTVTWFVCQPGIRGGFLFDDYANLSALGATGPIDNAPAFWRYVTSGDADPTGRPIAVASFLLDAHDWPADPHPFKRTNLLLHLLNAALLATLLLKLGRRSGLAVAHARRASLLGAALWALHPLFISTTFYIVQREAMLATTFVLVGLLLWLAGRRRLQAGQVVSGVLLEWAGLGCCTFLAMLSKANGALLPALALLIEWILLRPRDPGPTSREHRWTLWLLCILPTLFIAFYLIHTGMAFVGGPRPFGRPWSESQRLLTEPRMLWDYLRLLWFPRPFTPGLFNDQIHASTGLLHPWTTLPALFGVVALITGVFYLRRRAPLWAFALAFFLVGQSIESTTIPLELYFEHRNYLPALPLFWPFAVWLTSGGLRWPLRGTVATGILAVLCVMTYSRAELWGNTDAQALMWAQLNPDSPRAQSYAAQIMMARGNPKWAVERLRPLIKQSPGQIQIAFNLIGADCLLGHVPVADLQSTREALLKTRILGELSFKWLRGAIGKARAGTCNGLTFPVVNSFIGAAWRNPVTSKTPGWQQDILNVRGHYHLARNQPLAAYREFLAALSVKPDPAVALRQAATLGDRGYQRLAVCELDHYQVGSQRQPMSLSMAWIHQWVLEQQDYWPHEIAYLRKKLEQDIPLSRRKQPCPQLDGNNR